MKNIDRMPDYERRYKTLVFSLGVIILITLIILL